MKGVKLQMAIHFVVKKMACDMECRARGIIAISYLTT